MNISDTLIIGGGPAGLYSSFYAGLRGMSVQLIDHHSELGGKLNIYPEKIIWDIGGVTPAPAEDIKQQMIRQAKTFDPDIHVSTTCESIIQHEDYFETVTDQGSFYSRTIIIASGRGIFTPTRLTIEGADAFELTNLHYTVKRISRFKDQHVLISGAGNTAIDWADALSDIAASVTMVYRSEEMKGHEAMIAALHRKENIYMCGQCQIDTLLPNENGDEIAAVQLSDGRQVKVDDVLISHGYESNCAFLDTLEGNFDYNEYYMIETTETAKTPVPGIFACGDQTTHEGKIHLIAGCFPEAAQAANHAKTFLQSDAPAEGMVSSHNDIFKEKNRQLMKKMH
ncbi:NAD(P)/FAD-dependent oxidoreductase [Salinicoccus sp. ID82-1]|uniref:NAD(P)/FAD-dependent oxidoreductase n=1 Tax=Salinicoccus sp. ID82-1 TaxID=2820269 RepID=UPI001F38B2A1|nr:NAD(P)/FAD-dependent oxidoreductase [Salinicoccus sp. ID82-1]MCG1009778.1 NAD(P)/FAD-dependent oxidoreductase [Salinicoccus sp. ID82-1]